MTEKKDSAFGKMLIRLVMLVPTFLGFFNRVFTLVEFEARLACRSLTMIMLLAFLSALLLMSSWLCLLTILFFYFSVTLQWGIFLSLFLILLINIILLLCVLLILSKMKSHLLFPETFRLLRSLTHKK